MSTHTHTHKIAHGVGSTIKWTIRIIVLFILIGVVVAIIGIGSAANKSREELAAGHASQVLAGSQRMTQSELQGLLGKPERTDTSEISGLGSLNCWYYGILAQSGTYQFLLR